MASTLLLGDSRELLAAMEAGSVSAIVTDPPYEIGFMGRKWDSTGIAYDPEFWALCLRVLSPGGHLVSFGACRTYHRIACAIEDAGFEIRDSLFWNFGSGFPKSLDISKAIDKAAGAEREVIGESMGASNLGAGSSGDYVVSHSDPGKASVFITAPATPEAQQWDGWHSALKPSFEPIVLARKPLGGTIAETVLEHGTGGLNVDGCRVGDEVTQTRRSPTQTGPSGWKTTGFDVATVRDNPPGRWPPNVLLSPETAAKLGDKASYFPVFDYGDEDRFFYAPKASREEREAGCEHLPGRTAAETVDRKEGSKGASNPRAGAGRERGLDSGVLISYPESSWVNEVLDRALPAAMEPSRRKAIGASGADIKNGCAWNTCWCGSPSTDPCHPDIRSTIETMTSSITGSKTWKQSTRPHTNGCIAAAISAREHGTSRALSAESTSPWGKLTGTSAKKDGRSTADVDLATSVASWLTSEPAGQGKGVGVKVRNFHPT